MMDKLMTEPGEGERMEARRRRLFWGSIAGFIVTGAVTGAIIGYGSASRDIAPDEIWTSLPQPLAMALVGASLIAFFYGCWRFYKTIDEVELVDNLWGSTASYYVYATLFPVWWVSAKVGVVPQPNDWAIYAIALGGGALIYVWRKWRAR